MVEKRPLLSIIADPPKQHLWWSNKPIIRDALMEGMRLKGEEAQEDLEEDPIPVGMALTLWEKMQVEISNEDLDQHLGEDDVVVVEEQNAEDEVWNLLAELDSEKAIVEALQADETRHQFLTGLSIEGQQFQEQHMIEYAALTPVDVGFLLKTRKFAFWTPLEVMKEQTV